MALTPHLDWPRGTELKHFNFGTGNEASDVYKHARAASDAYHIITVRLYAIFKMADVKGLGTFRNLDKAEGLDNPKGVAAHFLGIAKP